MIRSLTLITLVAMSAAVAAEGVTSVRVGLTALPLASDAEFATGAGVVTSYTGEWDTASRFSISAYRNFDTSAPISFNIGAGLVGSVFDQYTVDGNATATDIEMSQGGIFIEPGLAFNLNTSFAIEVGVPIGFGSVTYTENFTGGNEFDGVYVELGLMVRPVLTLQGFQAFAELGYVSQSAVITDDFDNDLSFDAAGAVVSLGIGAVF
jgi:hypothetical protein